MKVYVSKDEGEKAVLVAAITNTNILRRIASLKGKEPSFQPFGSSYANLVLSWAITHVHQYEKAPGRAIKTYFAEWAEKSQDEEVVSAIERLLTHLSEFSKQQEEVNVDHVLDMAGKLFNKVKIGRTLEAARNALDAGMLDRAEKALLEFSRVEVGLGSGVDVFTDESAMGFVSDEEREPLFKYPGALGLFFHKLLQRETFLAFRGREKIGKSYFLMDMAYRALLARKRTCFFSVGDMTENQVKERLYARAAEHPFDSRDGKWPYTIQIPKHIRTRKREDDEKEPPLPEVDFEERKYKKGLTTDNVKEACQRLMLDRVKSKKSYFKVSCHSNDSITILGIKDILESWANQGWVADVVVLDYADILAPLNTRADPRDQIDATWKKMRAISQELHCLFVTATQTDAAAYDKRIQDMRNFNGDKRQNAHPDAIIGINQTAAEKELKLYRLNFAVNRRMDWSYRQCCYVAGNLDLCDPCMTSSF